VVERVGCVDSVTAAADLDRELGLGVDVRRLGRNDDRIARPDQRVLELAEDERLGRWLVSQLSRVLRVVEPDADDLHVLIFSSSLARIGLRRPLCP